MRLFDRNPQSTTITQSKNRPRLAVISLVIFLTLTLIVIGFMFARQSAATGVTIQKVVAGFQDMWPLSVDAVERNLETVALPLFWIGVLVAWFIAILALIVANRAPTLTFILIGISTIGLIPLATIIFDGVVFLAILSVLVLVALAGGRLFSERLSSVYMILTIGVSAVAVAGDVYIPWERPEPLQGRVAFILYIVLILAFGALIAISFRRYPLRQKLLFLVTAVSIFSIVVVAIISVNSTQASIRGTANLTLLTAASQAAASVDNFLSSTNQSLLTEAQYDTFVDYLNLALNERTAQENQIVDNLLRQMLSRRSTLASSNSGTLSYLDGYSLITDFGVVARDTNLIDVNKSYYQDDIYNIPFNSGLSYISPVRFLDNGESRIYFSAPIYAGTGGGQIGVLVARYNAEVLQQIIQEQNDLTGQGAYAILFEASHNIILGNGDTAQYTFRSPDQLNAEALEEIYTQRLLPAAAMGLNPSTDQAELSEALARMQPLMAEYQAAQEAADLRIASLPDDEIEAERSRLNADLQALKDKLVFTFPDPNSQKTYLAAYADVSNSPWKVVYAQSEEYFLSPVEAQVRNIQQLALAVAAAAAGLAFILAQLFSAPIGGLTQVASGIAAGDFSRRVPVETDDEIGKLAETVNSMAGQLEQTLLGLEKRVEDRTRDLARRSSELQAAAEVGRTAANLRNVNELLPRVCQLISERFDFYHVGVFLIDDTGRFAVLRAANSEGGQRMLARNHRLGVGQQGIVGYVTSSGQPRIALDVGSDAVFFNNPDLPRTRSEVALPLQSGGRLFGALDVQSTEASAFGSDDIAVLQVMADLVATAIENARLFEESQQALDVTRRAYGEISRQAWGTILQGQEGLGYRSTDRGVYVMTKNDISAATKQSTGQTNQNSELPAGVTEVADRVPEGSSLAPGSPLSIPIWVRDTVVGYLETSKPGEKGSWSEGEIETITKIVEQMGLALESARLYKGSQIQAERERLISEITSRMRESLDVETVLQVAAQQIRQALELKSVTVSLGGDELASTEERAE